MFQLNGRWCRIGMAQREFVAFYGLLAMRNCSLMRRGIKGTYLKMAPARFVMKRMKTLSMCYGTVL